MKVVVVVASKHGATSGIVELIAGRLRARGIEATVTEGDAPLCLTDFDAVILGSAAYYGRWLGSTRAFVADHSADLRARPVWLFSSSRPGSPPLRESDPDVQAAMAATGAREHHVFAGRLESVDLTGKGWGTAGAASSQGDFRDWKAVTSWADQIADELVASVNRLVASTG